MLNFGAIAATPLLDDPFNWALIERAWVSPDAARTLLACFPSDDFWRISAAEAACSSVAAERTLEQAACMLSRIPGPARTA
jgi:hypothetical protein